MEKLDQVIRQIYFECPNELIGKSTQVPQFIYEVGYSNKLGPNPGKIGVIINVKIM